MLAKSTLANNTTHLY